MNENSGPVHPPTEEPDQDAGRPDDGMPGQVHPQDPAEGPDESHPGGSDNAAQADRNFANRLRPVAGYPHSVRVRKRPLWLGMLLGLLCLPAQPALAASTAFHPAPELPGTEASRSSYTTLSATEFEARLFKRTNARRANHGCRPLRPHAALTIAARQHSARMASEDELSHRLANEPGLVDRAVSAGYTNWRLLAENLAWGQSTPRQVFRDWVKSPGHRVNLDNCRLRDMGLGVVIHGGQPWVTQDFGRRQR